MGDNSTTSTENGQDLSGLLFGAGALLLNGLTMTAMLISRSFPARQKVLFMSIMITDTLLGFQATLVRAFPGGYNSAHVLCQTRLYIGLTLAFITMFSNAMLTTERLFSLTLPVGLYKRITWKKIALLSSCIYIFGFTLTFSLFKDGFAGVESCNFFVAGSSKGYVVLGATMCIVFIIIFSMYVVIAKITRRHIRQIAATIVADSTLDCRAQYQTKAELRTTITVGIIIGVFGISYLPVAVYCLYTGLFINDRIGFAKENDRIFQVLVTFFLLNSLINPVIYIWRLKTCRLEMIARILCRPIPLSYE